MQKMQKVLAITVLSLLISGCAPLNNTPQIIDKFLFHHLGFTLFEDANLVSLKEIHLDTSTLLGEKVLIEASIIHLGKYTTYMVVKDLSSARMLVVLTDLTNTEQFEQLQKSSNRLKILGTVENGKKGLPFIHAKAISLADKEELAIF